ncbi:hypothetical protein D3C77_441470 [compost metagenome]
MSQIIYELENIFCSFIFLNRRKLDFVNNLFIALVFLINKMVMVHFFIDKGINRDAALNSLQYLKLGD